MSFRPLRASNRTTRFVDLHCLPVRLSLGGCSFQFSLTSILFPRLPHLAQTTRRVRIVGEKATLAAVIAGQHGQSDRVRGFVRKWRARRDSNHRPPDPQSGNLNLPVLNGTPLPNAAAQFN